MSFFGSATNSFLHDHLTDALDANKDIWKEMREIAQEMRGNAQYIKEYVKTERSVNKCQKSQQSVNKYKKM